MSTIIEPWLSVADATRAVTYYQAAFGATELERVESEPGCVEVAHLAIAGASFWVARDAASSPEKLGGRSPVRMLLVVDDPDAMFARALAEGATQVAAMHDAHGWHVGRLVDPSGHAWEIGRELA
jgi:PhnB protein